MFHGDSSINVRPDRANINDLIKDIDVEAVKLDEVLKDVDSIDLLKIDIEGGELHAFLGMNQLFKQKKIKTLAFEWNKFMLGDDAPLFINILEELKHEYGASFYVLDNEGNMLPTELDIITNTEFYPFGIIKFN
jgi:hypothetical protein